MYTPIKSVFFFNINYYNNHRFMINDDNLHLQVVQL